MIKLGILGSGAVLKWHLFGIDGTEGATIGAIASHDEETGRTVAERYGAAYYRNADELLRSASRPDGIINLTPNHLHAETCAAAIDAGFRHILCEKPLSNDIERSRELAKKARAAGTRLQVGYMKRFNPGFRAMKEALPMLGEIQFAGFTVMESGAKNQISHRDASSPWKTDPVLSGGGSLTHVGSHVVDFFRFLFGDVETVVCRLKRDAENTPEYGADAKVFFAGGVAADVRIGRVDVPNLGPDWLPFEGGWNEYVEIIGENGYIRAANPSWEGLGPIKVVRWLKGEVGPTTTRYESRSQWTNEIAAFVKGIEDDAPAADAATAADAYRVDAAVCGMRLSDARGGAPVEVSGGDTE